MASKKMSKALGNKISRRATSTEAIEHAGFKFGDRHYVMIVKAKRGELWNCGFLKDTTKPNITPLFEMGEKPGLPYDEQCETVCRAIAAEWGSLPHFLDVRYVGTDLDPTPGALLDLFKESLAHKLTSIPVTSLFFSPDFQKAVKTVIKRDQRGVMLRLGVDDFTDPDVLGNSIDGLLSVLNITAKDVDLLLDYGHRKTEADVIQLAPLHLALLPSLNVWRTVTIASASFPESISTMPMNVWHSQARVDWLAWLAIRAQRNVKKLRIPSFADYGVRGISSGKPIQNTPAPNLRYTSDQICLIRRGKKKQQQMRLIAKQLTARPEFMGKAFSYGDAQIVERAIGGSQSDGAAEHWILWCMNHHAEFVISQLLALP